MKTLDEWKAYYEQHSGGHFVQRAGCSLVYDPGKGFLTYEVMGDRFILWQVAGDGEYWDRYSVSLARSLGCKAIVMQTRRDPSAFERKYGYRVTGFVMEKEVDNDG